MSSSPTDGTSSGEASPAPRAGGIPAIWVAVFLAVFIGLVVSSVMLLGRDHLPVRFVDVEQTYLAPRDEGGTRLHLVLREAPYRGQLVHQVKEPTEDQPDWTVVIRLSAAGLDADAEGEGAPEEGARRTLEIDLPDIPRVRLLDLRFGRPESWVVERRAAARSTP